MQWPKIFVSEKSKKKKNLEIELQYPKVWSIGVFFLCLAYKHTDESENFENKFFYLEITRNTFEV